MDIYADDTTLSLSSNWKTVQSLNQTLSLDLCKVERWAREKENVYEYAKNKAFVGNPEASTEALSSMFRKSESKNA